MQDGVTGNTGGAEIKFEELRAGWARGWGEAKCESNS